MRNHVGKRQRGREKSGTVDHRGIVRTFLSQNQTDTGPLPKVPASLANLMLLWSDLACGTADFHCVTVL